MNRVIEELTPIADADGKPKMMGRNISVGFTPKTATVKKAASAEDNTDDVADDDIEIADDAAESEE
jgi:hypothetical protein